MATVLKAQQQLRAQGKLADDRRASTRKTGAKSRGAANMSTTKAGNFQGTALEFIHEQNAAVPGSYPSRPGPMRYRVHPNMPRWHKVWMTLDDPTFVNPDATSRLWQRASLHFGQLSMLIICVSTTAFLLESDMNCVPKLDRSARPGDSSPKYGHGFITDDNCRDWERAWTWIEALSVVFFIGELLLRVASAPSRRRLFRQGFTWIDIMAIVPWLIDQAVSLSGARMDASFSSFLQCLRVFRLARVFKLLRLGSSMGSLQVRALGRGRRSSGRTPLSCDPLIASDSL